MFRHIPLAAVVAALLALLSASESHAVTIGQATGSTCAPFGCAIHYQQIYSAGAFVAEGVSGPIQITELQFFNNSQNSVGLDSARYIIRLAATDIAVDGLNGSFANLISPVLFAQLDLSGTVGPESVLTIRTTGNGFAYDPTQNQNLLLDMRKTDGSSPGAVAGLANQSAQDAPFSRAYTFSDTPNIVFTDRSGLVTNFVVVPEPTTLGQLGAGAALLMIFVARRRSREKARI